MPYSPSSSSFPTSLTTFTDPTGASDTGVFDHAGLEASQNDAIEKLEVAVGITGSADTASLNYKLTNTSSSNPGHKHTLANGATDVTSSAAELNGLDGLTASRALVTNGSGIVTPATTTATEIGYVNGVTSAIQTQIDSKAAHTSGTITTPTIVTPIVKTAYSIGTLGTTETINWANGDLQQGTLDENVTLDFSNAVAGQRLTLFLLQDGTGTNTIAFTPTIVWQDATTPTWTTTANKMNVMVIYYSGSAYFGMGAKFA